jgi:CubicO group peptidase (beta-lactamase class C family)
MRYASSAIVMWACSFFACGAQGVAPARMNAASAALPDAAHERPQTRGLREASTEGLQRRAQLELGLGALVRVPFGTAASVSTNIGGDRTTASVGTLWDAGPAATDDTLYNVASVSKVLTAARIVSLAHAGRVRLDDSISTYLPGVRLLGDNGVEQHAITIRHLVQHRSGLLHAPEDLEQKVNHRWSSVDLLRDLTDSWELKLAGTPGQFRYSNTGYALLGAIIERVERCSFADCMNAYLRELGMPRSTFWPETIAGDAAHGRVSLEGQGTATFHPPGWYGSRYALPFTGLWTSMPELAHFGALVVAAASDPNAPLHPMARPDGPPLGLFRNTRLGAPSLEHDGSGPGFYAALVVVPQKHVTLAVATNGGNEQKPDGASFAGVVRQLVDAAPSLDFRLSPANGLRAAPSAL